MANNIVTITLNNDKIVDSSGNSVIVTGKVTVDYTTNSFSGNYAVNGNGINTTSSFSNAGGLVSNQGAYSLTANGLTLSYSGFQPTVADSLVYKDPGFAGVIPPDTYSGNGVPLASVACYLRGTLIQLADRQVAVEDLVIGDNVLTSSGSQRPIRWIGHRSYAARFANANPDLLPVCIKAGAIDVAVPSRDLWVSPKHAMYIDGVLIPAAVLVNGVNVIKAERVDHLEYWHVELDSHDIIIAEGAASETFIDDCSRNIFQNAPSFYSLYPDDVALEAVYCAPRLESGHIVAEVRRQLAERAGLSTRVAAFGILRGQIDICNGTLLCGWAQDSLYPDAPVCLDVLVDGEIVALIYADMYRSDLELAGIGTGHHSFQLDLPLADCTSHIVEVRRSADKVALATSPRLLSASTNLVAA